MSRRGCRPAMVLRATPAAGWGLCDHATALETVAGAEALPRTISCRRLRRLGRVVLRALCDWAGVRPADRTRTGCGAVLVTIAG